VNDRSPHAGAPGSDGEKLSTTVHRAADKMRPMSPGYVLHFQARVMSDALAEASAGYWRRRAEHLRSCLSRPSDFRGSATPEQVEARDARLRADIARCLTHAGVLAEGIGGIPPEVVDVLREVAA
jgi:hypothetical protein